MDIETKCKKIISKSKPNPNRKLRTKEEIFKAMQDKAIEKGGLCLSTIDEYKTIDTKYNFKCRESHEWSASAYHILEGKFCPTCNTSLSERTVRKIFEYIFSKKFNKIRPDWLIYNKNCELDGYCDELKLAFEYNGSQHYKKISHWHSEEEFQDLQKRDRMKIEKCKEKGIVLIVIPYTVKYKDLYTYIIDECKKNNITLPDNTPVNIDYKILNITGIGSEKIKEIQEFLEKNNYDIKIKSLTYISCRDKLEFECKNKHIFKSSWIDLRIKKANNLCDICVNNEKIKKINEILKTTDGIKLVHINVKYFAKLRCKEGHVFERRLRKYIKCPLCVEQDELKKKQYILNIRYNNSIKLLSTNYTNSSHKLLLECNKNHKFERNWASLIRKQTNINNICKYCREISMI